MAPISFFVTVLRKMWDSQKDFGRFTATLNFLCCASSGIGLQHTLHDVNQNHHVLHERSSPRAMRLIPPS